MVVVNRRTFNVKRGRMDEAVAAVKAESERFSSYTGPLRIYTAETGPADTLAVEWEYGSLEEYHRLWNEWGSTPGTAAYMEKWYELTEPGGTNELWWRAE